jgi:nucleoside phosphorylase
MSTLTHFRQSYMAGVICALNVEMAAMVATLDEEHDRMDNLAGDDNVYILGRIGAHNVVLACLPMGMMGKVSAAVVARDMMRSFPIKVGLIVGIGGGVWSERVDIRLGDIVVSRPGGIHGGVVQWDYGKMERDGSFRITSTLNKPPRPLLNAMQVLKVRHMLRGSEVSAHLVTMFAKCPQLADAFGHQGQELDELYEADCIHAAGDTCDGCDQSRIVQIRPRRKDNRPQIHYGIIASGDQVVKDGVARDRIARQEGILCFEMEAAGLMDTFPCVVIRGGAAGRGRCGGCGAAGTSE